MSGFGNRQRGFSVAEVLTVIVICGIMLGAMVMMLPAMLSAPHQMQSQVDDVNTAAIALYKIRRDFSQGDTTGVMGCAIQPVVVCSTYSNPTSVSAMAVASADDGSGQFTVQTKAPYQGYPDWRAVIVYWLVPNANNTAFDIMRAYIPENGNIPTGLNGTPQLSAAVAQNAVTAALAINPPPVLANYVEGITIGTNTNTNMVSFTLTTGGDSGHSQASTSFASNTYARN